MRGRRWLSVCRDLSRRLPIFIVLLPSLGVAPTATQEAEPGQIAFTEQPISFQGAGVTLNGTVFIPETPDPKPALAIVHGSGPGPRELNRLEAEAFAQQGIVTLIYDKRTEGYSTHDFSQRSYELLAEDALGAVRALRDLPEVNPNAVGLWGLSEGGWVVPLAASRASEVDFVVLVGASGVPPGPQVSWNIENALRHQGVAGSLIDTLSWTGIRVLIGVGEFAEHDHDPVPPLERLQQPVLAVWSALDPIVPPAESARIMQDAFARGGNNRYTIRFFPNANHGLKTSSDGYVRGDELVPEYVETVGSWVRDLAAGVIPIGRAEPLPEQERRSQPLPPLAWWESDVAQLAGIGLPAIAFLSFPVLAMARIPSQRRTQFTPPVPGEARMRAIGRWQVTAGLLTIVGFLGYLAYVMTTAANHVGPVLFGRPLPWLALQLLAIATVALTAALILSWSVGAAGERFRFTLLVLGGVIFTVWAIYWGLLLP